VRQTVSSTLLIWLHVLGGVTAVLPDPLVTTVTVGAALVVLILFERDLQVLWDLLRAERRMRSGHPPEQWGIDYGIGLDWWHVEPAADPYRAQDRPQLAALGSPAAARAAVGGNLLQRTGLGILAILFASAVGTCCSPSGSGGHASVMTTTALRTIRSGVIDYRGAHPGSCPSVADLKSDGILERGFRSTDLWGSPWEVMCGGEDVAVRSAGPDRRSGTRDDVLLSPRYPEINDASLAR
jgi:hypothetical protein